jgi:hypothetical protein
MLCLSETSINTAFGAIILKMHFEKHRKPEQKPCVKRSTRSGSSMTSTMIRLYYTPKLKTSILTLVCVLKTPILRVLEMVYTLKGGFVRVLHDFRRF